MIKTDVTSWGQFLPPKQSIFLRILIYIGLSRGRVRKKILQKWRDKFGEIVDIEVRGIKYRLNLQDNVTDRKIFGSSIIYDKVELEYLIKLSQGGVFVDIGANIGYYSLALAKRANCNVIAIEPNPVTLDRLRFNVELNAKIKDKIEIINCGVGEPGYFELHYGESLGAASLNPDMVENVQNSVTIETKPLLDILRAEKISYISTLKIDIEGLEDKALVPFFEMAPEALWPNAIVMENTHQRMWRVNLLDFLVASGYHIELIMPGNIILRKSF